MERTSVYRTRDGRVYNVSMSWNNEIKNSENVFPIKFQFVDQSTKKPLKLPREIATYAFADPAENIGDRVAAYYEGSRESMFIDYLESAYRRATDYVERGR